MTNTLAHWLCRYFTWDKDKFSKPQDMLEKLAHVGRKLVVVVDPHMKADTNFRHYSHAKDNDLLVLDKNDKQYNGWCWPGTHV